MKRAYIIGPYRDERGMWFVSMNIHRARILAMKLWAHGYAVFCPHCNSGFMDGGAADIQFLEGDIAWLQLADVAFLVPHVEGLKDPDDSLGSLEEIEFCNERGIPVVETKYDLQGRQILIPSEWIEDEKDE